MIGEFPSYDQAVAPERAETVLLSGEEVDKPSSLLSLTSFPASQPVLKPLHKHHSRSSGFRPLRDLTQLQLLLPSVLVHISSKIHTYQPHVVLQLIKALCDQKSLSQQTKPGLYPTLIVVTLCSVSSQPTEYQ